MQYLNESFHVSMPNISQERWDSIFSKDKPDEEVSFEKIEENETIFSKDES